MAAPGRVFTGTGSGRQSSTGRSIRGTLARVPREVGPWLYAVTVVCLMAVIAGTYLGQTTYVEGQVEEMERLEKQLRDTRWVNNDLLLEIAQHQHMSRIEEEATALGLGPAQQFQFVEVMIEESASPQHGDSADSLRRSSPLFEHLPDWLRRVLEEFRFWTAGPVVPAEQVPE